MIFCSRLSFPCLSLIASLALVVTAHPVSAQTSPAQPKAKAAAPKSTKAAKKPAAKPAAKPPAVGGAEPHLLGQYGVWGAYTAQPGGKKVCFALAKPSSSQTNPAGRPRDPAYIFISTRPAEKVRNEISVMIGYPLKPNSEASLDVGTAKFAMYTQNDGAWVKNAAEEPALLEAMRKGSDVTLKGSSARGTETTDVFSLKGISQALDRAAQECK